MRGKESEREGKRREKEKKWTKREEKEGEGNRENVVTVEGKEVHPVAEDDVNALIGQDLIVFHWLYVDVMNHKQTPHITLLCRKDLTRDFQP
jgi:hypothetical protein